ncbi:hypothetical protein SLEP1_g34829 [Rubroshorea leprosula]|uniref:Uncharacterized protein n=1 Tax=Rubroshorea leprosula TaxID=152421 RepID=A0AAV5KLJ9_9ROSI|nr:hypothetical protein SLEP1_g34829 [Rubroshorea leprosula]
MISEDFSFPKIAKPIPQQFMFSPSLWRVSSIIYPDNAVDEELGDKREVEFPRKSFSEKDIEEKMDMLWEDFNEELKRASSLGSNKGMKRLSGSREKGSESSRESTEELYCPQGLRVCKVGSESTTGGPVCHRRVGNNGMVVMKVLRKFFLLHSLVRIKKK